jgi:hypothetical protein
MESQLETQRDAFGALVDAVASCELDGADLELQRQRHRRLAPAVARVSRDDHALVIEFAATLDRQALAQMLAVESRCCPFFRFAIDESECRLVVSVDDPAFAPALDAIAAQLSQRC